MVRAFFIITAKEGIIMQIRIFLKTPEGKITWFNATSPLTLQSFKRLCDTDPKGWRIAGWFDENQTRRLDMEFSQRELAMILVALRLIQADHPNLVRADPGIENIASNCGDFELLAKVEIDSLCDRLNFGAEGTPIDKTIANIDWKLLYSQKLELLQRIRYRPTDPLELLKNAAAFIVEEWNHALVYPSISDEEDAFLYLRHYDSESGLEYEATFSRSAVKKAKISKTGISIVDNDGEEFYLVLLDITVLDSKTKASDDALMSIVNLLDQLLNAAEEEGLWMHPQAVKRKKNKE